MKMKMYNMSREFAAPGEEGEPIRLPFGTWDYDERVSQRFDREHAEAISRGLAGAVADGGPGIPVYQGHPDVPALAAKYPDKGALGWIRRMEVEEDGVLLHVEWDRHPGKGFAWFSPYWFGEPRGTDGEGKTVVVVDQIASVGLVNNPNISEFRLPNESEGKENTEKKENGMNREEIIKMLGLPAESTDDQVRAAIAELVKAGEAAAAEKQKAEAAEKKVAEAEKAREQAAAEGAKATEALENCKRELANEKAAHEKLKALKTASVFGGRRWNADPTGGDGGRRWNAAPTGANERMALVNEYRRNGMSFDRAWCAAKKEKPELFKD